MKNLVVFGALFIGMASFSACTTHRTCPTYLKNDKQDVKEIRVEKPHESNHSDHS